MRIGSLFSGIGGLDLGLERAGMEVVWQVENNPYCQAVLAKHWPGVKRYGDIKEIDWGTVEPVDLICGGFPCQPVSLAGKRLGQQDERWLWPEFARCVRLLRPRYVLVENVPGLLTRGFGDILGDLAACGYDAEWDCIPAAAVGAPHLRYRVFIVAHTQSSNDKGRDWFGRPKQIESGRSSWWATEPDVGRTFDGFSSWLDGFDMIVSHKSLLAYATTKKERPEEVLSVLRDTIDPRNDRNSIGGSRGISSQEVLFTYLCKLQECCGQKCTSLESQEVPKEILRSLLSNDKPSRTPPKRKGTRQHHEQPPDTLQSLSQVLARHSETAWSTYRREDAGTILNEWRYGWEDGFDRVAHKVPARVDRLRALGNAVVPQVAEWVGRRILECANLTT